MVVPGPGGGAGAPWQPPATNPVPSLPRPARRPVTLDQRVGAGVAGGARGVTMAERPGAGDPGAAADRAGGGSPPMTTRRLPRPREL
ncbi:hypothetical protein CHO01_20550 [Cellulomonas hominis]|uniref:Uncharacterized protein n=1 Tax=Cellulomonas hominis TaxID=156981 RepID=A0A511FCG5_9CELL|nr:hypothetical protein CHO01_20550 [Cellulomonas hominis]